MPPGVSLGGNPRFLWQTSLVDSHIARPVVLLGLLALAGCATPDSPQAWHQPRFAPQDQSDAESRLVIAGDLVAADRALGSGSEAYRRDGMLSVGMLDGNLAVPLYVGERAPSLDDARYLYLRSDHSRVLYFSDGYGRRPWHWYRR